MAQSRLTRGQVEAEITQAIIQLEGEHFGRGPTEARTWIIQDLILIRLKDVLTLAEEKLARDTEGKDLIKQVRTQLIEGARPMLEDVIRSIAGVSVVSLHSDISTKTGERIIVLTLAEDLEARFAR